MYYTMHLVISKFTTCHKVVFMDMFPKFCGWYNDLVNKYNLSLSQMLTFFIPIVSPLFIHWIDDGFFPLFPDHDKEHTAGVTGRQGCSLLHGTWSHLCCFGGPCLLFSYFVLFYGIWDWILFVISISFLILIYW